jgi:hypothetical protein
MRDGGEAGERPVDELAGGAALRVGDEADATGVALETPIVEERGCQDLRPFRVVDEREVEPPAGVSVS